MVAQELPSADAFSEGIVFCNGHQRFGKSHHGFPLVSRNFVQMSSATAQAVQHENEPLKKWIALCERFRLSRLLNDSSDGTDGEMTGRLFQTRAVSSCNWQGVITNGI